MNIGEASELCDFPAKTIRSYEDIGFAKLRRKESGYRQFDKRHIKLGRLDLSWPNVGISLLFAKSRKSDCRMTE